MNIGEPGALAAFGLQMFDMGVRVDHIVVAGWEPVEARHIPDDLAVVILALDGFVLFSGVADARQVGRGAFREFFEYP